ncbi:MAG: M18 family aminopeptidase [Segniliparus sp.]|uniref:M18 family aminopeptidase n=1 Tax=Segniliparus sp. TaxID=2804064 RepID=UPI003F3579F3
MTFASPADSGPDGLCAFVDASPTPFHARQTVAAILSAHGFTELWSTDAWPSAGGKHYIVRGAGLIAWAAPEGRAPAAFRIVAGHVDSPNLRVKQHADGSTAGWQTLALEPYGGAWTHTWLDRDLGLAGRVVLRDGAGSASATGGLAAVERLVQIAEPVLRVPQLAIHLAEERDAVRLNPQRHLNAVWGVGAQPRSLVALLAEQVDAPVDAILGFDLMAFDLVPSAVIGVERDLVSAPRLDNQASCHAGVQALLRAAEAADADSPVPVLALFDHEEVGSVSERGAASEFLTTALERIVLASGGGRAELLRAFAGSACASADMAHATHPNYPDRHEPGHWIYAGQGPVLKVNQNLRYATDGAGEALFALACQQAGVPLQRYMHRADLPCGSTVGPVLSARTGMTTVDVGAPQLAMHSARELMAAADVEPYARALAGFLSPQR